MIILANRAGGVGMSPAAEVLQRGGTALDAAEAGIRPVELDPTVTTVGLGGLPNLLGQVELDASMMDGRTLRTGSIGALQGFLHPISVARQVMERLPHVFLVGEGAARFAAECGAERGELLTEQARAQWESWLADNAPERDLVGWPDIPLASLAWAKVDPPAVRAALPPNHGTTTFLVQDAAGDIAAGVSTSGWAFKYPGRLGDSPVIGAGSYADNRYGAAACTGTGELTIRAGTARSVVLYLKMGFSLEAACHEALDDLRALSRAYQGGIALHAVDARGRSYAVTIGVAPPINYWLWTDGMASPEARQADAAAW